MDGFLVRFRFKFLSSKWILKTFFQLPRYGQSLAKFVFSLLLLYLIQITSNFIQSTGTSTKFVNMTEQALHHFEDEHGVKLEKITKIPLEGNTDTVDKRVERYAPSILS